MRKHERMKAACAEKMARTQGKCVDECLQIGWCKYVYKAVEPKTKGKENDENQSRSRTIAASADDKHAASEAC